MKTIQFKTNINCSGCLNSVSPFLNEVDNIDMWKVDIENPDKILEVTLDNDDINTVIDAVTQAGFEIKVLNT